MFVAIELHKVFHCTKTCCEIRVFANNARTKSRLQLTVGPKGPHPTLRRVGHPNPCFYWRSTSPSGFSQWESATPAKTKSAMVGRNNSWVKLNGLPCYRKNRCKGKPCVSWTCRNRPSRFSLRVAGDARIARMTQDLRLHGLLSQECYERIELYVSQSFENTHLAAQRISARGDRVWGRLGGIEQRTRLRVARDTRSALYPHQVASGVYHGGESLCWRPQVECHQVLSTGRGRHDWAFKFRIGC